MNDEKTYRAKNGDIIPIPAIDGIFYARVRPDTPLNNVTFLWPDHPPRGSCIVISSTQPISNISHDGAIFDPTFMAMSAGDISHVWCHLRQSYLGTGENQRAADSLTRWVRLKSFFNNLFAKKS